MKSIFIFSAFTFLFLNCRLEDATVLANHEDLQLVNGVLYFGNDAFEGNLVSYYKNGEPKSHIAYRKGRKNGIEKQWHDNGVLAVERFYENGVKVGIHRGWYDNTQQQFEYHFNGKGYYDGIHKEWYATGQLAKHFNYANGREVNLQRLWKPDGSIKANYMVKNGERFGLIGLKKCNAVTANSISVK